MDLSQYSDEELKTMLAQKQAEQSKDLSKYSDVELKKMANVPLTIEEQKAEFIREHPNTPKWMIDMAERAVRNDGKISTKDYVNAIARGVVTGSDDLARVPLSAAQGSLESNLNPVGFIAQGSNYMWGNGKWELPEFLRPIEPQNDLERGVKGAAKTANDIYGAFAYGKGAKTLGLLGQGVSKGSKIANFLLASDKPATVARSLAQGEFVNDYFDIKNPAARFGVSVLAANPIQTAKGTAILVGKGTKHLLGLTTGMGNKTVGQLYDAGTRNSKLALEHMRGRGDTEDIVDAAKGGLSNLKKSRSVAYQTTKEGMAQSSKKLNTKPLNDVYNDVKSQYVYKGWKASSKNVDNVLDEAGKIIRDFEKNTQAHDAVGFDTLKQRIAAINTGGDAAAETAKRKIVNGIKEKINQIAPEYSKMMKDYSKASRTIDAMEEAFSLTRGGDTIFNKIKSALRDNVLTNYGRRAELAQTLEDAGAYGLKDMVAGQAARSIMPRGLAQSGLAIFGLKNLNPAIALMSPRLVGEAAYKGGQLQNIAKNVVEKTGLGKLIKSAIAESGKKYFSLPATGSGIYEAYKRKEKK